MPTTMRVEKPVATVVLRALKTVADASRGLADSERDLLEAAAHILHTDEPLDSLAPIEPEEAGAIITNERDRTRLVEAMLLMAMMDQEVDKPELVVIDQFAKAWKIDEPRIKNLHQYVDGHRMRMKLDVLRRSYFAQKVLPEAWKEGGLRGVWKAFAPRFGKATDPDLAWRYKQLGLLPEGTLGREYWTHLTTRKFSMPGEPYGFAWQVVHDMGHLLGDHDTDPVGEIEQAAFEAGYMRRDPFFLIFATTMIFHLGFAVLGENPLIPTARGAFDPKRAARAYERGLACNVDLTDWDYWPHVDRPIEDVRRDLGIPPK
jgi:ubiquinone biosynthesis protein Coq4